jgi:hypothetical protein
MGRFDELQQLDQMPRTPPPARAEKLPSPDEKARKPASGQAGKPEGPPNLLPTKPLSIVTARPQARTPIPPRLSTLDSEIPEKYTTRLRPSMVRHVKIFAAERDINDYEVVEKALMEYFERNT